MTDLTSEQIAGLSGAEIRLHEQFKELGVEGTPVNAVEATQTLTIGAQPTADDYMFIAGKLYTFVANGTAAADGEINVGTDKATAQAAIRAAILGTDGYNVEHPLVTISTFSVDVATITAKVAGAMANEYLTSSDFTSGSNLFGGATMEDGVDGSVGVPGEIMVDGSYLYICTAVNLVSGKNWRQIQHSALS